LAEPTLPANPSQADHGAQLYWLHCMPCHGEKGQGLTDEFRATYPPEDNNCWARGCHGERPYEDGFTLPTKVPPLIGRFSLRKFPTAASLQAYTSAAMPFWNPGSLPAQENWAITAFLLRANGLWSDEGELNAGNAAQLRLHPAAAVPTATAAAQAETPPARTNWLWVPGGLVLASLAMLMALRTARKSRGRASPRR
jgi:hypothetical protein